MLKFFWNGIKGSDGKMQFASFSDGKLTNHPEGTLTIYADQRKGTCRFKGEVCEAFEIKNDSDSMTDYFETDSIRVLPSHPLYNQVKAALAARKAHFDKRYGRAA